MRINSVSNRKTALIQQNLSTSEARPRYFRHRKLTLSQTEQDSNTTVTFDAHPWCRTLAEDLTLRNRVAKPAAVQLKTESAFGQHTHRFDLNHAFYVGNLNLLPADGEAHCGHRTEHSGHGKNHDHQRND